MPSIKKNIKIPRIALLINTERAFERGLVRGIARYACIHGPWEFYRQTPFYRQANEGENLLARIKNWEPDGLIMRENKLIKDILNLEIPTIVSPFSSTDINAPLVLAENYTIGLEGAKHLLSKGFQNFGFCGFDDQYWSMERGKAFAEKIKKEGKKIHWYHAPIPLKDRLWENEPFHMAEWLKKIDKPAAIMTATDERAQQIMEAARISGFRIPEEIALLGVDNDELICELSTPPLSSIDINPEYAGYLAAELLHRILKGQKIEKKNKCIKPRFVVTRHSTDIYATQDQQLQKALNYINKYPHCKLTVNQVVSATSISRRRLEERFRKHLKKSILEEIKRVKIEKIKKMLSQTNLSISEIGFEMGFQSIQNISRYFKTETGLTPQQYRKQTRLK